MGLIFGIVIKQNILMHGHDHRLLHHSYDDATIFSSSFLNPCNRKRQQETSHIGVLIVVVVVDGDSSVSFDSYAFILTV